MTSFVTRAHSPVARRFGTDRRGSINVVTAIALPALLGASAIAVDMGALYVERRDVQSITDLAALAAVTDIDRADDLVALTMRANRLDGFRSLVVKKGHYRADLAIPHRKRFTAGETPYNAVEVTATKPGMTFLARALGWIEPEIDVRALGVASAQATYSLGSRLLSVRDGLPNAVLGAFLGGNISLNLMDYRALLDADVKLGSFMNALATELNVSAGTYDDVLRSNANVGHVLRAAITVLQADHAGAEAAILNALLGQTLVDQKTIDLRKLVDLGASGRVPVGSSLRGNDARLNVLDLVTASATAGGAHQLALDLGASIPGLTSVKIDLTIGERAQTSPWVRVGSPGSTLRTAQTRLRLVAEIGGSGILSGVRIRLPIALDLAYAEANLLAVNCAGANAANASVDVAVKPGIAKAWIGEITAASMADLTSSPQISNANIVSTPLLSVSGRSTVSTGATSATTLNFTSSDIADQIAKTAETQTIVTSLVTSLLGNLSLEANVAGLSLATPTLLRMTVAQTLLNVAPVLDKTVHDLLATLGVHVGEADVRVHGVKCGAPTIAG